MSRVLVTGASGFIGQGLPPLLAAAGHEVHAVSTAERGAEAGEGVAQWHRADLLDPGAAAELIAAVRPERLLHLAWYTEHGAFWSSVENLPWVEASVRLWRAFAAGGGERALMVGSCAEYQWGEPVLSERETPCRPASLYGACKDAVRRVVESASAVTGTSSAWARVFFVYGPEESSRRLVASVARALIEGRPAPSSAGEQVRDFIHVSDAASALATLLDSAVEGPVNVGSGAGVRVREVVEGLGRLSGRPELIELGALPGNPDEPDSIVADVGRLRDEVGWAPSIPLEQGLAGTLDALRAA